MIKNKVVFIVDKEELGADLFNALKNISEVIDYSQVFIESSCETDFKFDKHWNNCGRELIAKLIIANETKINEFNASINLEN